ncbi:MAG: patatin family protein, partial [Lachnospiraceae bacterium]|nr:patatin family protein [Lachnospiraceae bacterium]
SSFLAKQRKRAFEVSVDYLKDKRYAGIYSRIKTGDFFGVDMVYNLIPNKLNPYDYDEYERYTGKFFAVVTNCKTGKSEYIQIKDMRKDILAIRASSSLPVISRMVEVNGKQYLDGGVTDSIPIKKSIEDGNIKNVVILTRDRTYRKPPSGMMRLIKAKYKKYPMLVRSIEIRHIRYNHAIELVEQERKAGRAYVIQPEKPVGIGRLEKNKEKLIALYNQGYSDGRKHYKALTEFLNREN